MLRMIMGRVPGVNSAEIETQANTTLPLTPYYAELFADIAKERGFDGYLLNIEIGLGRGAEQARALAAWITILQSELVKKVGPHAQTIWYDSVTIRGELWWQDRLNSANLPFFLNSSGIFTNYWVCPAFLAAHEANMNVYFIVVQRRTSEAGCILQ